MIVVLHLSSVRPHHSKNIMGALIIDFLKKNQLSMPPKKIRCGADGQRMDNE